MDALSDVLRAVRLAGAVYLDGEFSAPWSVVGQADASLCASYLPRSDRILAFHLITEGGCWAMLPHDRGGALRLVAGDLVVVPQGEPHILGSAIDVPPVTGAPLVAAHAARAPGDVIQLSYGGGGEVTRMVCGFLAADDVYRNPLLAALPRLFKVDMRGSSAPWLESSMRFAAREAATSRAGSATVLAKLSELLFVEAVRRYVDALPEDRKGWLAGLRDRFVGRALSLLHARPAEAWTVDNLARGVGMSRSALAHRFADLVGSPPMQYLAHWRLQLAAQELRRAGAPLAQVAEQVGYESEAAFNRAFKREFGTPPATWRRRNGGGVAPAI
jgi:AraC family transcriptional regulator, alkane utilization regulator